MGQTINLFQLLTYNDSIFSQTTDGTLKMRKLRKHVSQALKEAGLSIDEDELSLELERKV